MATQPTIVLLHGAGTGAWVWDRVIDALESPGIALDVPAASRDVTPDSCAAELVRELDTRGVSQVALVLHSLAAVLAPGLARRLGSRLTNCVFVAGVIPPDGGAFVDALPLPNRLILKVLFVLKRGGLKPSPAMIRRELCNDLTDPDTELVVSRYRAEMPGLYLSPTGPPAPLPHAAYIRLLRDQTVRPPLQDAMISRLSNARVYDIDAGHLGMLSAPDDLAAAITRDVLLRRS